MSNKAQDSGEISFEVHETEVPGVHKFILQTAAAAERATQRVQGSDRDELDHVAQVLRALAGMVQEKFHLPDYEVPDLMGDIVAFHQKYGLAYDGKPRVLESDLFSFRDKFMTEEQDEWREVQPLMIEALTADDGDIDHRMIAAGLNKQLDALVDKIYVTLGTAYMQGFNPIIFYEAWSRVHGKNLLKVRVDRAENSTRGSTFDVVKPAGWTPPDHHDLVVDHAHVPEYSAVIPPQQDAA